MLPRVASLDEYKKIFADSRVWLPAVREISRRHGLPDHAAREVLGTHIVYGAGEFILKIFCPLWLQDFRAEKVALAHLLGLPVPVPVAEGEIEGWPYLVMSRVEGVPAGSVWPELTAVERGSIVRQLGQLMRSLHDRGLPEEMSPPDWDSFIRERLAGAESHHDAPEPWRGWIRKQLNTFREPPLPLTFLNGDITEDHLLVREQDGAWEVCGLIDFGDARVGHPYYEFIAPLAHYTYGAPALSIILLEAYGLKPEPSVFDALTGYCLLHEFGRLSDFLERHPVNTPEQLYEALWGRPKS